MSEGVVDTAGIPDKFMGLRYFVPCTGSLRPNVWAFALATAKGFSDWRQCPLPTSNAGQLDVERSLLGAPWVPDRA